MSLRKPFDDFFCQNILDFSVTGNRFSNTGMLIFIPVVVTSMSDKSSTVFFYDSY